MRMSKIHKIVATAVVTTIATATVLTFTRGDSATADRVASLPESGNDSPLVASRTPGATTKPTPTPSATTTSPDSDPVAPAPKPAAVKPVKPSKATTKPPAPTTEPAPSPTPTQKNLLEILLGQ
jgi:hypothetical protein